MFLRPFILGGGLLAAVVVPYLALNENLTGSVRTQWNRLQGQSSLPGDLPAGPSTPSAIASSAPTSLPVPIEQAFRFDATPQWVASRWPRVSTVLGQPKQLGMRVALVTGTRPDDIAGSLTYYFDEHHQLQRITFTGLTADPRRLLALLIPAGGLQSQPTTSVVHYIAGDAKRPTSQVIARHLPVVANTAPGPRVEVAVDLARGDFAAGGASAASHIDGKLLPSSYRRW
jgi:uncharacterized protein DUF6690